MENTPTLYTERLMLRKFKESDLEDYLRFFSDPDVAAFFPMNPLKTLEEAKAHIKEHFFNHYEGTEGYHYAVCMKEDQIPIGFIDINDNGSYEVGYGLRKDFWRRGIATEACRAVLDCMKRDGVPFATSTHDIKNPRSGEVMKKLGMTYQYSFQEKCESNHRLCTIRMYQINFDGNRDRVYWKYWDRYPIHFVEKDIH